MFVGSNPVMLHDMDRDTPATFPLPVGPVAPAWDALTPTERRVADLARLGHTNNDIAAALAIGAETVKTHLSRTYAKLKVANRTQLAALARPPDGA